MSVRCFVEQLGSIGPHRMTALSAEGTVSDWFILVGPDRPAGHANCDVWNNYTGVGNLWAWYVCTPDQAVDVEHIRVLDALLNPAAWVLNIEGEWTKGASLKTLVSGVRALGSPIIASLAGSSASHAPYDYRTLDRAGVEIDWQAYIDSGEGPTPAEAVAELYRSSFVIPGWEYRHRWGGKYGWGIVSGVAVGAAFYDSYLIPGRPNAEVFIAAREEWGYTVAPGRRLWAGDTAVGLLLGRARYSKIAVTLDVTRSAQAQRDLAGWEALAASARVPGASKRPISVYLGEVCPDDVLRSIARGAA